MRGQPDGVVVSTDDDNYEAVLEWATAHGGPTSSPKDAGFEMFTKRVQPMPVERGCVLLGRHSSPVFNELRPRPPSGGHFGVATSRHDFEEDLEVALLQARAPRVEPTLQRRNLRARRGQPHSARLPPQLPSTQPISVTSRSTRPP